MELPVKKIKAEKKDPRNLIIFSKPKIGKSTACAMLDNNLCIDLEGGYAYIDALKVECKNLSDIKTLCSKIIENDKPYKYITIDSVTELERLVEPLALKLYKETPAGTKFVSNNILDAPMGAGYAKIREAIDMVINMISSCAENVILICHTKDSAIANSDINVRSIDLSGKSGRILCAKSDAIGYMYRDDDSNTILSFNTNDKFVECGARPEHLRNKDIVLGEMKEDGTLEFHWERVYPSLDKNA